MKEREELLGTIALELGRWARSRGITLTQKTRESLAHHAYEMARELFKVGKAEGLFGVFCGQIGLRRTLQAELATHFTRKGRRKRTKKEEA